MSTSGALLCKWATVLDDFPGCLEHADSIRFFVGEDRLATWWNRGATGCYSSLVYCHPGRCLAMYEALCPGDMELALGIEKEVEQVVACTEQREGTYHDSAADRLLARLNDVLDIDLDVAAPYTSYTEQQLEEFRRCVRERVPAWADGQGPTHQSGEPRT